ncbi:MAG: hypothetical protein AAGA93_05295 [Actinomycetota bacterium]
MTFHERSAATIIGALLLVFGGYFVVLIGGVDRRVDDFAYKPLLILAVVAFTALMTLSHIVLALRSPEEANTLDERDRTISQRADQVGGTMLGVAVLVVISLTVLEVAHVYIANALLFGLVAAQIASEGSKLWLYRRTS